MVNLVASSPVWQCPGGFMYVSVWEYGTRYHQVVYFAEVNQLLSIPVDLSDSMSPHDYLPVPVRRYHFGIHVSAYDHMSRFLTVCNTLCS